MRRHPIQLAALVVLILAQPAFARPRPEVLETDGVGPRMAERIFSESDAAVYFPGLGRARWMTGTGGADSEAAGFLKGLERDYPRFREGPYLLKVPSTAPLAPSMTAIQSDAVLFTDSFEAGLSAWDLSNNTLDLYGWGTTTCAARSGSHSADAIRGGVNTLACGDPYAPDVVTTMTHKSCEGVAGASQAWVDVWIQVASQSGHDTLGFYYDGGGTGYGYAFAGNWPAWFHVVLNLKQWYWIGDVTAGSCPRLKVQFKSDSSTQSGLGARIDDLTVGTGTPSFLACSLTATPATGPAPLTVNFTSSVSNGSAATEYLWTFGDAASTSATTRDASFTYTTPGTYPARLRVAEQGVYAYASKSIVVTAPQSCSLTCGASVASSGRTGQPVVFQATASATACASSPSYSWNFGDGSTSTQQNPSHAYSIAGTYGWSLTVSAGGTTCARSGSITLGATENRRRRAIHPPADDALDSEAIGAAGGTLSGGGFTLTVPPGAFSSTAQLTLRQSAPADGNAGEIAPTFAIEGLPESITAPLTVEVDVPGGLPALGAGEGYYVSFDADAWTKNTGATAAAFPIAAAASGNRVTATIPATWTLSADAGTGGAVTPAKGPRVPVRAKTTVETRVDSAHFFLLTSGTPSTLTSRKAAAESILNMMEGHYQKLIDLGFSLNCRFSNDKPPLFRPIYIDMKPLGTTVFGNHVSGKFGGDPCGTNWMFGSDFIEITTDLPPTDNHVKAASAHELFHLVQDTYSPGGPTANMWLKEASSVWFETVVLPTGYCPEVMAFIENVKFAWNGLFNSGRTAVPAGTRGSEPPHGYGAAAVLKYRTDALPANDPFVRLIWDAIHGGSNELAAFQGALGSATPLGTYWNAFGQDYFFGTAPGACFPEWASFFDKLTRIDDESALPASVTYDAYPLCGRSWALNFNYWKPTSSALPGILKAEGLAAGQSVYVAKIEAKTRTSLAELTPSNPTYSFADLNVLKSSALVAALVDRNLPVGDASAQSSTNKVTLSLVTDAGFKTTTKRENGGTGDTTPTSWGDWVIEPATGAWRDPAVQARVWVTSAKISLKARVSYKAAPPDYTTCDSNDEWCSQYQFLGFTGTEELWCFTCPPGLGGAPLATASSAGATMEVKDYTMPTSPYDGSIYSDFIIRVHYRFHYKEWNKKTGEVRVDMTRDTMALHDAVGPELLIQKQ